MGINWTHRTGPKNALTYHRLVAFRADMGTGVIEAMFASYEDEDHRITVNAQGRPIPPSGQFKREFTREELEAFGFDWEGSIPAQVYKMMKKFGGLVGARDNNVRLSKRKPIVLKGEETAPSDG